MTDSFARLFPTWYRLPPRERVYHQQIIVDWLDMEIEPDAPRRMPILNELRSWRNREVYYFIADGWDWTRSLFETGQYFPRVEDPPERFRRARKSHQAPCALVLTWGASISREEGFPEGIPDR